MPEKICESCGKNVEDSVKFCPYCGSSQFRQNTNTVVANRHSSIPAKRTSNNDMIHRLLYWNHGEYYIFSKTKLISILTFIVFILSISSGNPGAIILLGLIFSVFFFVIGFAVHKILGNSKPSKSVLNNNDLGLIEDLKHALLCWQNKHTGDFVFSKTKIITLLILLFFSVWCAFLTSVPVVCLMVGLIFAVPSGLIGYVIHKFTNNNPTPKKVTQKPKPQITPKSTEKKPEVQVTPEVPDRMPKFSIYESRLDDLRKDYNLKENRLRNLIEKRFEPPQLTYDKFMASVDNCTNMFNSQADSIQSIIDLASDDSKRVDDEIKSKFESLELLTDKIEELTDELLLSMDKSDDTNVKNLLDDMDGLIDSVNNYD